MRKVPVLVVSLAAVTVLMGMPVSAATLFGTDLPGYKLKPGETGNNVFDLNDFFDSATAATISYTASGKGSVAGSIGSVFGDAAPAVLTASWSAQAGGETINTNSVVKVTNFLIGNGPVFDDNNRIVGLDGGVAFLNGIVPGKSLASVKSLVGILSGGQQVTPAAVSGGASLVATIGQVAVQTLDTGLQKRTSALLQAGDGKGKATGSLGVTATLKADGSYTIATTKADFTAPAVVTFGSKAGSSVDGVSFLVAPATEVALDLAGFTQMPTGAPTVAAADGKINISCKAGEYVLLFANAPVSVAAGSAVTISMDYQVDSTDGNVAVAAFDGAVGAEVSYYNAGQGNLAKNVVKNVALTVISNSGKVIPAFQVYGKSAVNATISKLAVIQAGPLTNYAMNPNAKKDIGVDGSFGSTTGLKSDILGEGLAAFSTKADNNFASPTGAGSIYLAGATGAKAWCNAWVQTSLSKGTAVAEAYVKRDGAAGSGAFVVIATDGVSPFASFVASANVPTDKWLKVIASATLGADAPMILLAVQAAGFNAFVDDLSLRIVKESDRFFDPVLLGM